MDDLCVARVPIFQGLTRAQQEDVARLARPASFAPGDLVYAAGQDNPALLVVHTGSAKISRTDADGNERVLRVLGPGQFTGEAQFLTGHPSDHSVIAVTETRMCTFRFTDFASVLEAHPGIAVRMLQGVSQRLDDTERRLAAAISSDVSARLAGYLLSLPAKLGPDGPQITFPLSKKDVASLLDTTPESLSRQLRALRESGVVAPGTGGSLVILNVDMLNQLSPADSATQW